jgi:VIT1/CCC1 family predicted Fe2+/Mn2+ transporter
MFLAKEIATVGMGGEQMLRRALGPRWLNALRHLLLGEDHHRLDTNGIVLRVVQPGLAGLMDGSVSTLAPIFAAAVATRSSHTAWVVGMAAAVGAGISMGFAEALSDTGELTGRGDPLRRGSIVGICTFGGGFLHTLPFLIPAYHVALTLAVFLVGLELITISFIRHRFFHVPLSRSSLQVMLGGGLVFLSGLLLGQA